MTWIWLVEWWLGDAWLCTEARWLLWPGPEFDAACAALED